MSGPGAFPVLHVDCRGAAFRSAGGARPAQVGRTLRIGGWVRTGREAGAGAFAFLEVSDGSCFGSIQARPAGAQPLDGQPGRPRGAERRAAGAR